MYMTLFALVYLTSAKIDNTLPKIKSQRYSDSFPTVNNEDWAVNVNNESAIDELVVHPSISFRGRSRRSIIHSRAISGLSPEFLDDKAADAIFTSQSRMGSPAPPTPEQYEQIFSITNKAKTLIEKSRIVGKHLGELQQESNALVARRQRIFPPNTVVIPFDSNINPEFPADAPRARGLINVPKGWNYNREVDMEFQAGYKWRSKMYSQLGEINLRRPDLRTTVVMPTYEYIMQHRQSTYDGMFSDKKLIPDLKTQVN